MPQEQSTGDPGLPEPAHITDDDSLSSDTDAADADSFAEKDPVNDPAQDRDDADPTAVQKPPFDDDEPGPKDAPEQKTPGQAISDMDPPGQDK